MREFDAQQLEQYLKICDSRPFLLDVRQPWEYDVCHIAGSLLIPMGQIPNKLDELDKKLNFKKSGMPPRSAGAPCYISIFDILQSMLSSPVDDF